VKKLAAAFVFLAAAVIQWWQICYRLHLFLTEYKGELNVNHIGDGDFLMLHTVNALLLVVGAVALRIFRQERRWRKTTLIIGSVNLAGWLALFFMHRTGMLVEYIEFIRHMKGMN